MGPLSPPERRPQARRRLAAGRLDSRELGVGRAPAQLRRDAGELRVHRRALRLDPALERLEPGSRVLDVGIGTAGALVRAPNPRTVRDRHLSVVGLDYEACYVAKAKLAIAAAGLSDAVSVHCESVYDVPRLRPNVSTSSWGGRYMASKALREYHSGPLMLVFLFMVSFQHNVPGYLTPVSFENYTPTTSSRSCTPSSSSPCS